MYIAHTLEYVQNFCKKNNIEYVDDFYNNVNEKHQFRCLKEDCEYEWETSFDCIHNAKTGCSKCVGNLKFTLKYVQNFCKEKNIEFVDSVYNNSQKRHNFRCLKEECGYLWKTKFHNIHINKTGCSKCAGNLKLTLEYVKDFCLKRDILYLNDGYNNANEKHNFRCLKCSYEWKTTFSGIHNKKTGCRKCASRKNKDKRKLDIKYIKDFCLKRDILYLNDYYNNSDERHNFRCLKCFNKWTTNFDSIHNNKKTGCPNCVDNLKSEKNFQNDLQQIFPNVKKTRGILSNKRFELDNYDENLKIAIEFDGRYWHNKERDTRKELDCLNNGIFLIRIDDNLYRKKTQNSYIFENIKNYVDLFQLNKQPKVVKIFYNNETKNFEIKELTINNYNHPTLTIQSLP